MRLLGEDGARVMLDVDTVNDGQKLYLVAASEARMMMISRTARRTVQGRMSKRIVAVIITWLLAALHPLHCMLLFHLCMPPDFV